MGIKTYHRTKVNLRWVVDLSLLAFPAYTTLILLFIIQTALRSNGDDLLFVDYAVTQNQFCQVQYGFRPATKHQYFTMNPNQWGWKEGEPGSLCMNVYTNNNYSYPTKSSAPPFSSTWQLPKGPHSAPVRAFPNAMVSDNKTLPVSLASLKHLDVESSWTYGVGIDIAKSTDLEALEKVEFNADVAIDMFFDKDEGKSRNPETAAIEIMVWLGRFGPVARPIGVDNGTLGSLEAGGVKYDLYQGLNAAEQHVYTWAASAIVSKADIDIALLINYIQGMNLGDIPALSDEYHLGYVAMGTEAMGATENVTFSVNSLSIDIQRR